MEEESVVVCRLEREKDLSFYIAILFEKNAKFLTYYDRTRVHFIKQQRDFYREVRVE